PTSLAARVGSLRVTGLLPADPVELTGTMGGRPGQMAVEATVRAGRAGGARLHGTFALDEAGTDGRTLGAYDLEVDASPLVLSRLASGMPEGRVALALAAH